MVAVYGDIQAKDDYTHPLGPESNFNESMYSKLPRVVGHA